MTTMTATTERAATTAPAPAPGGLDVDALYRADRDRLVRIAAKVAPTRDAGEDAVQDAFVRLLADPGKARDPQAFVTSQAKFRGLEESRQRGKQKPAGDAIDRLADTASPADDGGDLQARCMGDPATAAQVAAALATLPERDRLAVELHCLEGRRVSEIAQQLGVHNTTVYNMINRAMAHLREHGVPVDAEQPDTGATTRLDDTRALLGQVAAGRRVAWRDALEILSEHGRPRTSKVVAAAVRAHNDALPPSAPRYLDRPDKRIVSKPPSEHQPSTASAIRKRKPHILRAAAFLRSTYGATPPEDLPRTNELARRHGWDGSTASYARSAYIEGLDLETPTEPAPAENVAEQRAPLVTEAWLRWADADVTCMFVRDDESTARHPVTFRSMSGAQREVTGLLVDEGYRPDGPWVGQVDDESMRRFSFVDRRHENGKGPGDA